MNIHRKAEFGIYGKILAVQIFLFKGAYLAKGCDSRTIVDKGVM